MKSAIDRIKLIFLGVFLVACLLIWGYQANFVWPAQACEARGDWWDEEDRVCAVPVPIWTFTHRMPGQPKPSAATANSPTVKPSPAKT